MATHIPYQEVPRERALPDPLRGMLIQHPPPLCIHTPEEPQIPVSPEVEVHDPTPLEER